MLRRVLIAGIQKASNYAVQSKLNLQAVFTIMNRNQREQRSSPSYAQRTQDTRPTRRFGGTPYQGRSAATPTVHRNSPLQPVARKLCASWGVIKMNPLIIKDRALNTEEIAEYTTQLATSLQTALFFSQDELPYIGVLQDMISASPVAFEHFIRATQQYFLALASLDGAFIAKMLGVSDDMNIKYDKAARKIEITLLGKSYGRTDATERPNAWRRDRTIADTAFRPTAIVKNPDRTPCENEVGRVRYNENEIRRPRRTENEMGRPRPNDNEMGRSRHSENENIKTVSEIEASIKQRQRPRGGKKVQKKETIPKITPPLPDNDSMLLLQLLTTDSAPPPPIVEVEQTKQTPSVLRADFSEIDWA